jgi:hypothetical protein
LDKTEEIEKALGNVDEDKCSLENIRIQNDIKNIKQGHMVELCNGAAARLEHPGLVFECGDVRSVVPSTIDVMIALHACDIATDYAIHTGIRCGAAIIMCSPCCHKQIRPQLHSPGLLKPMLQYGLHLGQQAEMLTDSLRALYLEACGYETKVFEFISLEHTNKNKMILAVKRQTPVDSTALLEKIQQLKAFYGVKEHCLETLLRADGFFVEAGLASDAGAA